MYLHWSHLYSTVFGQVFNRDVSSVDVDANQVGKFYLWLCNPTAPVDSFFEDDPAWQRYHHLNGLSEFDVSAGLERFCTITCSSWRIPLHFKALSSSLPVKWKLCQFCITISLLIWMGLPNCCSPLLFTCTGPTLTPRFSDEFSAVIFDELH